MFSLIKQGLKYFELCLQKVTMITKAYVKTGVVNLLFFIQTKIICVLIWMTHTEHYNFPSNNPIHFNLVVGNTLKVNYCICFFFIYSKISLEVLDVFNARNTIFLI